MIERARHPRASSSMAGWAASVLVLLASAGAHAAEPSTPAAAIPPSRPDVAVVDRVVVRWASTAIGGASNPQFVMARELAFSARIEALAEGYHGADGYADKHVRAALRRHITERLLAHTLRTSLGDDDSGRRTQLAKYARSARQVTEQRVGGAEVLRAAAEAEGIAAEELDAAMDEQARASYYLDRMVAPMLEPTEADLREVHQSSETPFADRPLAQVLPELRRWLVAKRLAAALERYFRNAQSRLEIQLIGAR